MKLVVGNQFLGRPIADYGTVTLFEGERAISRFPLPELQCPDRTQAARYLPRVRQVVVGYVTPWAERNLELGFLRLVPSAEEVWIVTDQVRDLAGLRHLKRLRDLAVDRPTCRMDVIGELVSLEKLYLDDWRPGADSIFRLSGLRNLGVQKFGHRSLEKMSHWSSLDELWFNAGRLEDLTGVPLNLKKLRLTSQRKLRSLRPLTACPQLEELIVQGCRGISSLEGVEACRWLRMLSVARCAPILSLEPLRTLASLEYLVLADGSATEGTDVGVLYELPNLHTLIIPKKTGLQRDRVLAAAPHCDVRLTVR